MPRVKLQLLSLHIDFCHLLRQVGDESPFLVVEVRLLHGVKYLKVHTSVPLILLNIYAPHFDSPDFFSKIFNLITQHNDHIIITGGDFNCYFDPRMDRSLWTGSTLI